MTLAIPEPPPSHPGVPESRKKYWYATERYGAYPVPTKSLLNVLESPAAVVRGSATARSPTGHLATAAGVGNSFGSPSRGGPPNGPRISRKRHKISTKYPRFR